LSSLSAYPLDARYAFRPARHNEFHRRDDALFAHVDNLLADGPVTSLPHLRVPAAH
jgi:hypothetical protein